MAVRVLGVGLSAAMMAVAARVLGPSGFGAFSFVLALVAIASIPATIGLRQLLARETAYALARDDTARISAVTLWAIKLSGGATLLVSAALAGWALWGIEDPQASRHVLLGAGILVLLPLPRLFAGALQGLGRVALSQIPEHVVRPLAFLSGLGVVLLASGPGGTTVTALILVFAGAVAVEGLLSAALTLRDTRFRPRAGIGAAAKLPRRALMLAAISFGAIASAHLINGNLDVIMLGVLATDAEAGVYRAASFLSELVVFGLGVINTVIMPRIAALHAQGNFSAMQALVTRSLRWIFAFALGGALILVAGGPLLLPALFGPGFAAAYPALLILALGQLANAAFGPVALILNMTGHEKLTLAGLSVSVVANALLNLLLIPRFGIMGAAVATASSLLAWNLLLAILLYRRTGIRTFALPLWRF